MSDPGHRRTMLALLRYAQARILRDYPAALVALEQALVELERDIVLARAADRSALIDALAHGAQAMVRGWQLMRTEENAAAQALEKRIARLRKKLMRDAA